MSTRLKIQALSVVDDQGVTHTWEGVEGYLVVRSQTGLREPHQLFIDAHLVLEEQPREMKEMD